MIVLTLNGGSSSLKFGLYCVRGTQLDPLMTGEANGRGLRAQDAAGVALAALSAVGTPETTIPAIARLLADACLPVPQAIGHRIVHGGPNLCSHCLIDDAVLRELEKVRSLAPLHAPTALAFIAHAQAAWPDLPQVACFDTVFHTTMPDVAHTLPLPCVFEEEGIRRYGFHGLSCESIVHQLGSDLPSRTIIAHLGNGASVTAVRNGRSIDTSMGLTPSGGIVMGTRTGDIDPGVLIYLAREKGYDPSALEQLFNHRAGLLGISGLSSDMRMLHAAKGDASAQLAIEIFSLSAAKQIAAMIAALDGVDTIVFTGGIGEHDVVVRAGICRHLAWIGIHIDDAANEQSKTRLDCQTSRSQVLWLPSQEDEQIGRHVAELLAHS